MKIIVTTSNKYLHILPIFCFLFNKFWSDKQPVEIVGYDKPEFSLPGNFSFHSLGKQIGGPENFSTDLRAYFEKQDQWFIWMMEDTFLKAPVLHKTLRALIAEAPYKFSNIGKINLTNEFVKRIHKEYSVNGNIKYYCAAPHSDYRLSTQPSIWNREFLLKYLTDGLTPWKFETQESINDGWDVLGVYENTIFHNEGVRKNNIYDYNFDGVSDELINEMKHLYIIR